MKILLNEITRNQSGHIDKINQYSDEFHWEEDYQNEKRGNFIMQYQNYGL
jgi:hypothetical protein